MIYQPVNITCKNTVLEPHNLAAFLNVAELIVSNDVDLFASVGIDEVARVSTLGKMDFGNSFGGAGFGESVSLLICISTSAKNEYIISIGRHVTGTVLFRLDECKELGIFSVSVELDCWMVKGFAVFG